MNKHTTTGEQRDKYKLKVDYDPATDKVLLTVNDNPTTGEWTAETLWEFIGGKIDDETTGLSKESAVQCYQAINAALAAAVADAYDHCRKEADRDWQDVLAAEREKYKRSQEKVREYFDLLAAEQSRTAAAKRMQEDGARSHGKTALMCEKRIKELEQQLAAERELAKKGEELRKKLGLPEHWSEEQWRNFPQQLAAERDKARTGGWLSQEALDEYAKVEAEHRQLREKLTRDGNWLDKFGCCKICDGEIPYGHTANCDIWKLEQQLAAERVDWTELRDLLHLPSTDDDKALVVNEIKQLAAERENCKSWYEHAVRAEEELAAERDGVHTTACKLRNQLFEAQQAALKEGIRSGKLEDQLAAAVEALRRIDCDGDQRSSQIAQVAIAKIGPGAKTTRSNTSASIVE
jgi:hypothetical protein